ncbi:hypothetical protein LTS15_003120 [Exophiala xenobiotica]|nr:hypothetical protein LTS15_003120 [Exophiala xenobiotica]
MPRKYITRPAGKAQSQSNKPSRAPAPARRNASSSQSTGPRHEKHATTVKGDGKVVNINRRRAALKGKPILKGLDLDAIIRENGLNCSKRTLQRALRERVIQDPTAKDRLQFLWSRDKTVALQALGLLPTEGEVSRHLNTSAVDGCL